MCSDKSDLKCDVNIWLCEISACPLLFWLVHHAQTCANLTGDKIFYLLAMSPDLTNFSLHTSQEATFILQISCMEQERIQRNTKKFWPSLSMHAFCGLLGWATQRQANFGQNVHLRSVLIKRFLYACPFFFHSKIIDGDLPWIWYKAWSSHCWKCSSDVLLAHILNNLSNPASYKQTN